MYEARNLKQNTHVSNLDRVQEWLRSVECHGLLIPSSDEYLSEFTQPFAHRLGWVTGFAGSTGLAIILQDRAALFLDGRYKSQGERDTAGLNIEILDASEASRLEWLAANLHAGQRLALDTRLQSHPDVERLLTFTADHDIHVIELEQNPIDELWGAERPAFPSSTVIDYPTHFAGAPAAEKCARLQEWLRAQAVDCHLLADPEDVAWLLNVRTDETARNATFTGWQTVPVPLSRVLVEATGKVFWFVDPTRLEPALVARIDGAIEIIDPVQFEPLLQQRVTGKVVSANLRRTPHKFASIAAKFGGLNNDAVLAHWRWSKHANEIERAREGHYQDGQAVIRFMAWVERTVPERTVTELDAAQKLSEFRNQLAGYKGISMPLMSASGPSGAMAHYVPSQHSNRRLNDHPIYWMDSGGQYYGCSTDNTVCLAVGTPEPKHIRAHTLVIKGFIALTLARFPTGIHSTQLDSFARQHLWQEGMDYNHGTGHGVGNFTNIHEGPHIAKEIDRPLVARMAAGMIVSNEPAYYIDGDFGVRVESHMLTVESQYPGFLEFETLSRLPIDPRLIDKELLSSKEKEWLKNYHLAIVNGYQGCFDEQTEAWLQGIVDSYIAMAAN